MQNTFHSNCSRMDGGGGGSISSPNQPAACAVIGSRSGAKPLETSVETLGHDRSDNDDSGGHTAQEVAMRSTSSPALELSPRADAIALAVVTALALAVRLHKIPEPDAVVFDEMHHGRFALHYLRGQFFFDIHPPLGKLLFALAGHWTGLAQVCMRPCMHAGGPLREQPQKAPLNVSHCTFAAVACAWYGCGGWVCEHWWWWMYMEDAA